jgi:uncharacterized membrane protein YhaH (DUF805 family)
MEYQDGTGDNLTLLKNTLIRSFDISGRSRRKEVVYYWIASILANMVISFSILPLLGLGAGIIAAQITRIALSIPAFALFIRRVHDQNRSGAWIAAFIAFFLISLAADLRMLWRDPKPHLAWSVIAAGLILWVACMALTFLPGTDGRNKYGDDPRM